MGERITISFYPAEKPERKKMDFLLAYSKHKKMD